MTKRKRNFFGWKVFCVGFIILFSLAANAQIIDTVKVNQDFNNQPLVDFIDYLQNQKQLKVFYKKEWISDLIINQRFDDLPLSQALTRVFRATGLAYEFFQDNSIILYPQKSDDRYRIENYEELLLVIGDPVNIGKYRTAKVTGRIVNGENGEPLPGAVMYVSRLEKGTSTNVNGVFEIELPTGEHNIQLTFMGFEQSARKIKLIENGEVEFELFEESHRIGEVTVTGRDYNVSRAQMSLVSIDSKIISELPVLMGETDIIKSLTMMAGVQTVSELASGFNVRGGNTDQNLVLVNGAPAFNTSHLFGFFSMLNPDVINNVMLYKGGLPAKFGERVSSVMEIDIKEGNDETMMIYGGLGIVNSRLTLDGPLSKDKKLKLITGGRTSYSDWILKKIPDAELSQSVTNFYDISGKATYDFNLHNKLSLMAYSSNDEFSTSAQSVLKYGNMLINLFSRNRFSEVLNGELNLSYSSYKSQLTDKANDKEYESYHLDNRLQYYSSKYHFNWHPHERHDAMFGINFIGYKNNPGKIVPASEETFIEPQEIEPEKAIELAGYISDEFRLSPEVTISAGLRYSRFSNLGPKTVYLYEEDLPKSPETIIDSLVTGKNKSVKSYGDLEPRLAINYKTDDGYDFKLSYQKTQQFINLISNNAVISPAESWKLSDYHLKPLTSNQVALGVSNNELLRGINLTTEIYYKQLQNLIEYKNGAEIIMNPHLETDLLPSDGYSYGAEVSVIKPTGRLTGMLNYMFSRTMRKTDGLQDEESINSGAWYPSVYDKPHDLSVSATYHISRRWRLSGNFVYISGRPVTLPEIKYEYAGQTLIYYSDRNKYRMPAYHRFDIAITIDENLKRKRSWKGSWTLSVYNVYGRQNPYSVYYRKTTPGSSNNYSHYSLYKLSVIGIPVPTLTYNFRF